MKLNKLSIIIPVYNEKKSINKIISKIHRQPISLSKEIIIVDDGSRDGTRKLLKKLVIEDSKIIYHEYNQGKGAAVRTGLKQATGDVILIQDADLEYDPIDYPKLLEPIILNKCSVVYGTRFMAQGNFKTENTNLFLLHMIGNAGLTLFTNVIFDLHLTDMETGYKVFTRDVLKSISPLRAKRFDLEPEITAKIAKRGYKIIEVPINYYSRGYREGKNITWKDGIKALYYLIKYKLIN